MGRTVRGTAVSLVAMLVLTIVALPSGASATSDAKRATHGAAYLVTQQSPDGSIPAFSPIGSTSDAVLAFVASGVGREAMSKAVAYLKAQTLAGNVNAIGLQAKVVMALVAAGKDPSSFGRHDLAGEIDATLDGSTGRYGNASVFDDALATIALHAAGYAPPPIVGQWLLQAQCPDGGWAYDAPYDPIHDDAHCHSGPNDFFDSDSNTTGYVVMALEAVGMASWVHDPFRFLETLRDPEHGGWSYDASFVATDANSTALVIQAYTSAGRSVPRGGLAALRHLQHARCGAWAYSWNGNVIGGPDVGATIAAIPAVLRDPLPIAPGPVRRGVPNVPACV
jgi:hypothetical protein